MHPACRGQTFYRSLNFPKSANAFDVGGIPAHNLASKKEVKVMRVPDLLGERPAGWNASTLSGSRFPDRPMMRVLSEYDAHKRADYNFRAEQLDHIATTRYIPRPSKMQTNERALDVPRLQQPHPISRLEFPVHVALEDKPRWDGSTGHAGDAYHAEKERDIVFQRECAEVMEYSKRHPPKAREESLMQREERFMREKREAKAHARASAIAPGMATAMFSTSGGMTTMGKYGNTTGAPAPSKYGAEEAEDIRAHMVPVKNTTSWSLGGF